MTRTADPRYYAFGNTIGRMRVPDGFNEDEAIVWAKGRGATNVQREDGPASKPAHVTLVWTDGQPSAYQRRIDLWEIMSKHFPNATVAEIGRAITDLQDYMNSGNA